MRLYFVYIISNWNNKVIYAGVTKDLERRIFEHKNKLIPGFSKRYNLNKLVFYEEFNKIIDAIAAEKKIKGWMRVKKNRLIEEKNPRWKDLSIEF